MKKQLLAVSTVFCSLFTYSQITISDTDLSNLNDSVLLSTAQSFLADYTSTGAGTSWDFSDLTPNSQYIKTFKNITQTGSLGNIIFGQFAAAKYQASYFVKENNILFDLAGANFPVPIEGFNRVVKKNADSLTWIGVVIETGQGSFPVKSDTIETRYVFPMDYGQTHSSHGYTYLDMNPMVNAIWIEHRQISSEVDGWGTLSSPYNDYSVIRVHHDIIQSDSVMADLQGTGTPTWAPIPAMHMHEYEWFAMGEKEPVLKILTQEVFGFEVVQSIEYKDIYHPEVASLLENTIDYSVAPNPATGSSTITCETSIESIKLLSSDGKLIQHYNNIQSNSFTFDLNDVPAGVYLVEVSAGGQIQKSRLVRN